MLNPLESIYSYFRHQVNLHPNNIALIDGCRKISYSQLANEVDKVANALSDHAYVKGQCVAILLEPSSQFLVAMFACLKIGMTYIPLNLDYPTSYLQEILTDASIGLIILSEPIAEAYRAFNVFNIDQPYEIHAPIKSGDFTINGVDAAYVIYTSGSTGAPKGVMITQENLLGLLNATQNIYNIDTNDNVLLFHSLGFDFSVWEICVTILSGGTLVIVPNEIKQSAEAFVEFLIEHKISVLNITPSLFYQLQQILIKKPQAMLDHLALRLIITGGEALYPKRLQAWFELPIAGRVAFYNMYGITEGTIHSTVRQIVESDISCEGSPIGKPLSNTECVVLDEDGKC